MSIIISGGGGVGITVESDPTAVKLTGSVMSGELSLPQIGNLLNTNIVIDSYNDTGAGTHYYHTFTPFDGKFNLAPNGGGLTFPDTTTQTTAGLPLTGGTLSGKLNTTTTTAGAINFQVGVTPASPVNGDVWMGNYGLTIKGVDGVARNMALTGLANTFSMHQSIDCNSSVAGLRVTQRGTGHAILVEDESNPDYTPFVVTNNGQTVIGGLSPFSTASLTIVGTIAFNGATTQGSTPSPISSYYPYEIVAYINGTQVYIPYRT
jgi:hypothetical protein